MPNGQFPVVTAGGTGTAGFLASMLPPVAYKTIDTSRATTTAMTADPDLQAAVVANAWYFYVCVLDYEGGTQGSSDFKLQFSVPAGSSGILAPYYVGNAGAQNVGSLGGITATIVAGTNGAGSKRSALLVGTLNTGSSPGTFALTWAQNVSSATATIVHAGSAMFLLRMA